MLQLTATECRRWLMWIHTCVKEKSGYFEYNYGIPIYQWHSNILVDIC